MTLLLLLTLGLGATGCAQVDHSQRVIFLDGAGHAGAGLKVKHGLRSAGYRGEFRGFVWTSFLLWGADHLMAARSDFNASRLAGEIKTFRAEYPDGYLALMGLSAGSAVIVNALEQLPDGIQVDNVVLFQPSISATRDLAPALGHVTHRFYVTCSRRDAILAALVTNADGEPGPPAGRDGIRIPPRTEATARQQYRKAVNLPWRAKYRRYGWGGGHITSTDSGFVKNVIAPRILAKRDKPEARDTNAPTALSASAHTVR